MFFKNRIEAGQYLAQAVRKSGKDFSGFEVIGLARGGVPVAKPVAESLGLPLKAMCIDDLSVNGNKLVLTTFGSGLLYKLGRPVDGAQRVDLAPRWIDNSLHQLELPSLPEFLTKLRMREQKYNNGRALQFGSKVLLIDDGMVSGTTIEVAVRALRQQGVEEVVVAIPVVLPWTKNAHFDFELISWRVSTMKHAATGMFYYEFEDTPDQQVMAATA